MALLLAAGCRANGPADPAPLTIAVRADITGVFPNPPILNETYTTFVNRNIFEGLVGFDRNLKLVPALAARWESPDERTTICHLQTGLRFSNGEPVRVQDVVASLHAARDRRWVTHDYLQAIETVEALDARRVLIRTREPYPVMLSRLAWGFVLPASALSESPVPPIGTGPYVVEHWLPGRELALRRNPHYRGEPAAFKKVRFVVVPDAGERVARLLRGEADVIDHVPFERIRELEPRPSLSVVARPGLIVLFLGMRISEPPFSDPRVREAVELALDRQVLIDAALGGYGDPAGQLVPRAIVGYNPSLAPTLPDRRRARALLAAAGYARGLSVRLDGPNNRYAGDERILAELTRQLAEVGIHAETSALDKGEFFPLIMRGESSFYLFGWASGSGEAGDTLDALFHSPAGSFGGGFNTFGLADAELDRLIEESNRSGTGSRAARLQEAVARVHALRPVVPLLVQWEALAYSGRVRWDPPLNMALRLEDMSPAM